MTRTSREVFDGYYARLNQKSSRSTGENDYFLTHLSEEDLERYFRLTFSRRWQSPDEQIVPPEFEEAMRAMFYHHGEGGYLARKYVACGKLDQRGEWGDHYRAHMDPAFRRRCETLIMKLTMECLKQKQPTEETRRQAQFIWDFLRHVYINEGEDSPLARFEAHLEEAGGHMTAEELLRNAAQDAQKPDARKNPLLDLYRRLEVNPVFARLLRETR